MVAPLLFLATLAAPQESAPPAPGVRLTLSDEGEYRFGDRVKVRVETTADAYVFVVQVDPLGRVRPLLPLEPAGDHYVRGGKKLEIKGRGGREAFTVGDSIGRGVVLAAASSTPFEFALFERAGHWDYRALADTLDEPDPEAHALDLARRALPAGRFTYDIAAYVVERDYLRRPRFYPVPRGRPGWWWWDPFDHASGISITIGSRWTFGPYWYSGPWRDGHQVRW